MRPRSRTVPSFVHAFGPGCLHGFLGELDVTAHDERDASHVVVVRGDEPGEGDLITGGGPGHHRAKGIVVHHGLHTL